jgi:hypothetical protein
MVRRGKSDLRIDKQWDTKSGKWSSDRNWKAQERRRRPPKRQKRNAGRDGARSLENRSSRRETKDRRSESRSSNSRASQDFKLTTCCETRSVPDAVGVSVLGSSAEKDAMRSPGKGSARKRNKDKISGFRLQGGLREMTESFGLRGSTHKRIDRSR